MVNSMILWSFSVWVATYRIPTTCSWVSSRHEISMLGNANKKQATSLTAVSTPSNPFCFFFASKSGTPTGSRSSAAITNHDKSRQSMVSTMNVCANTATQTYGDTAVKSLITWRWEPWCQVQRPNSNRPTLLTSTLRKHRPQSHQRNRLSGRSRY
jgi:hypothetical protein